METAIDIVLRMRDRATREVGSALRSVDERATATAKAVGTLALGVAAAGAAFYAASRRALAWADEIGKTADKVGLSTAALQELRIAAGAAGVEQRTLDMAMQRFSRRLGEAQQGTGELLPLLNQYGIRAGSLESVLGQLSDAMARAGSDQERLRIAFKAFDSEGAALVNLLGKGSGALAAYRAEARATGAIISDSLVRGAEAAYTQLGYLEQLLRAQFYAVLVALSPAIQRVVEWLREWTQKTDLARWARETIAELVPLSKLVLDFAGGVAAVASMGVYLKEVWSGATEAAENFRLRAEAIRASIEGLKGSVASALLEQPPAQGQTLRFGATLVFEPDATKGYWEAELKRSEAIRKANQKRRQDQQAIAAEGVLAEQEREAEIVRMEQGRYRDALDRARAHQIELQRVSAEAVVYEQELQADAIRAEQAQRERALAAQKAWVGELRETYREFYRDFARGIGDAFADALVEGRNFVDSMKALFRDLARTAVSYGISRAVLSAFPAPAAHGGGVIGADAFASRMVSPEAFAGARRYHGGGLAGDEVPAVLRRGEGVFTPGQMRAMGGAVEVHVHNHTGSPVERSERRLPGGGVAIDLVVGRMGARDVATRGPLSQTLERVYGLRRAGAV